VFSSRLFRRLSLRSWRVCRVSRRLHLFSVSVQLKPTGVTQEGVNTARAFFPVSCFFLPTVPLMLASVFLSREGFSRPSPSSKHLKFEFVNDSRSYSAVLLLSTSLPGIIRRQKNKNRTLAEIPNSCGDLIYFLVDKMGYPSSKMKNYNTK